MRASYPSLQDPETFSSLFARTQLILFRFIYAMHGGPVEEVEDLTCDTFLRAWKNRMSFSGDDHDALCWLFTIARHLVIDAHRHRKSHAGKEQLSLDEANIDEIFPSAHLSLEEQAANRELYAGLWKQLHQLAPDKREILVLRYMLGWKVKEIAEYLHKEENTISVYIRRYLELIRHNWPVD